MKRFKRSSRGMKQLLNEGFVADELSKRAKRIASAANANAPVGETGQLSRSHQVVNDRTDRARARVVSNLPYAITIEANTGYLSRSLEAGK